MSVVSLLLLQLAGCAPVSEVSVLRANCVGLMVARFTTAVPFYCRCEQDRPGGSLEEHAQLVQGLEQWGTANLVQLSCAPMLFS